MIQEQDVTVEGDIPEYAKWEELEEAELASMRFIICQRLAISWRESGLVVGSVLGVVGIRGTADDADLAI